ncbi:uncharacterized protein IL334_004150 [Kwoniella shivajii]|uniref:Methyltransferase domain-containing protein n=1 Tax=Kwoniella shivajii TaxID=564305 RepID=A0ABZ1D0W4_9TREE|nr:hypothetical protein IL334_004150 [Kwoniella shivajii]
MDLTLHSIASRLFLAYQAQPRQRTIPPKSDITTEAMDQSSSPNAILPVLKSNGQKGNTRMIPVSSPTFPPSPLILEIPETDSPPRHTLTCGLSSTLHGKTDKEKLRDRPITPMDFFGISTDGHSAERDRNINTTITQKTARTSLDQRPVLDSSVKGIPQGWEDDPSISTSQALDTKQHHQSSDGTRTAIMPRSSSGVSSSNLTPMHKLGPLKETRSKLQSFSGTLRSGLKDRGNEKDKEENQKKPGGLKLQKENVRYNPRSSSIINHPLDLSLTPNNLPTSPRLTIDHQITQSKYSDAPTNTENSRSTVMSIPLIPPSASTESTETSTAEFAHLFTPTSQFGHDYPASVTSSHSAQSGMKTFKQLSIEEVLPFAAGHPFAAWSAPVAEEEQVTGETKNLDLGRRASISLSRLDMLSPNDTSETPSTVSLEGWRETPRPRSGLPGKRIWVDAKGDGVGGIYSVGWEREVMDLEARLHETMYDIAGERHSFTEFDEPPKAILDLGTGAGFWPISMALQYPTTTFVGLDLAPCQIDLSLLADAERRARSTRGGEMAEKMGIWESVDKRITWQKGDFLHELPFDTGVFDLVHIRFVNLGIPETKWYDIFEEATRVLKRGGKIEIVEMSYTLPSMSPASLRNSFASTLLANMIQPLPSLAIQFNLPSVESLKPEGFKPIFEQKWVKDVPGALEDAVLTWVKSAMEYRGTGLARKNKETEGIIARIKEQLGANGGGKWNFAGTDMGIDSKRTILSGEDGIEEKREVIVSVWVVTKK